MTFLFHLSLWVLKGYNKHKKTQVIFYQIYRVKTSNTHPTPKMCKTCSCFLSLQLIHVSRVCIFKMNTSNKQKQHNQKTVCECLNSFFSIICMLFKMKYIDKSHCHRRSNYPPICKLYLPSIVYASLNQRIPVTADDSRQHVIEDCQLTIC